MDEQSIRERDEAEALSRETIRSRALSGAALIAMRGVVLLVLAAVANAVLARQLSPHQYGIVAFGLTVMTFANVFSDGGLGAALIRSAVPLERSMLKSVFGLQLTVSMVHGASNRSSCSASASSAALSRLTP